MKFKKIISAAMALAVAVSSGCYFNRSTEAYADSSYSAECSEMLDLINEQRETAGVQPLKLNITACSIAQQRAQEISVLFDVDVRPNGGKVNTIFEEYGVYFEDEFYELAAHDYNSPQELMDDVWEATNIMSEYILDDNFEYLGIGHYVRNGRSYWVQEYLPDFSVLPRGLGDANGDGNVDAIDASAVLEYYAYKATYPSFDESDEFKAAANVNGDAAIDAVDASYILSYYAYRATGGKLNIVEYFNS